MTGRLPDFVIIGAMKCGTSTLHEQLARRPGLFMSEPKEPNFFADDEQYARGLDWYAGLFEAAHPGQRCGESSTHYTKRPTYPHVAERMRGPLPKARLIYVMRDPLERMVSQYIHEWTQRDVDESFERAVQRRDRFVAYSRYAYQLEPFLQTYGAEAVLPLFFERLLASPDAELARVCRFIGDPTPGEPRWLESLPPQNVSSERLRRSSLRDGLLALPPLRALKDRMPESWRERVKMLWRMPRRPDLSPGLRAEVEARIDADLERLGSWLGRELRCDGWGELVAQGDSPSWVSPPARPA